MTNPSTESLSVSGSLISTINPALLGDQGLNQSSDLTNKTIKQNTIGSNSSSPLIANNNTNEKLSDISNHDADTIMQGSGSPSMPNSVLNKSSSNTTKSNNMSDNLVSILSGIIIQSLENGNPTVNTNKIEPIVSNNQNKNISIIVAGKWSFDINEGIVSKFDSKFVMITSNSSGFHWHFINNFKSNGKLIFDDNGNAIVFGNADFFTGKNSTGKKINLMLTINNLELIQISFLDKVISDHFYGFPVYGVIDSIKINN